MNILQDYSIISGLKAEPSKTKLGKLNGIITPDEKLKLIQFDFQNLPLMIPLLSLATQLT